MHCGAARFSAVSSPWLGFAFTHHSYQIHLHPLQSMHICLLGCTHVSRGEKLFIKLA